MEDWKHRISIDAAVSHGRPCIKGTRVWVSLIIDNLAGGVLEEDIRHAYGLSHEDVLAALGYAAEMTRERYVDLPIPSS